MGGGLPATAAFWPSFDIPFPAKKAAPPFDTCSTYAGYADVTSLSDCDAAVDTINAHYGYSGHSSVTGPVAYSFMQSGCHTECFGSGTGYFCGYYNTDTTDTTTGVDTSDDDYMFCTC